MIPSKNATQLSRLFHLNSEPWSEGKLDAYQANCETDREYISRHDLPAPSASHAIELMRMRQSSRYFLEATINQQELATILIAAYGAIDFGEMQETGDRFLRRTVPSAGGLYPLELYLLLSKVEGLQDGIYHYDETGHTLELIASEGLDKQLQESFLSYPFIKNANVILCHSAVFDRTQKKYGPRGYRYILLEAGHSAQNVCLAAAELGLGSLCMGGFWDRQLNNLLQLEHETEGVVYSMAVGKV